MLTKINKEQLNSKIIDGSKIVDDLEIKDLRLTGSIKQKNGLSETNIINLNNGIEIASNNKVVLKYNDNNKITVDSSGILIDGNVNITGSLNYTQSEVIQLTDNTILLNSNFTGNPTENASIDVERGNYTDASIRWNETLNYWEISNPQDNANAPVFNRIVDVSYGDTRYLNADGDTVSGDNKLYFKDNNSYINYDSTNSYLQIVSGSIMLKSGSTDIFKITNGDVNVYKKLQIKTNGVTNPSIFTHENLSAQTYQSGSSLSLYLTDNLNIYSSDTSDASINLYSKNKGASLSLKSTSNEISLIGSSSLQKFVFYNNNTTELATLSSAGALTLKGSNLTIDNNSAYISIGSSSVTTPYILFNGTYPLNLKYTNSTQYLELTDNSTGYRHLKANKADFVGNVTLGSAAQNNIALTINGPNSPTNSNSAQDISFKFNAAGSARIRSYRGSSWDTYMQFLVNNLSTGSDNPSVAMHINHDGNIGIGTTTPNESLEVINTIRISNNIDRNATIKLSNSGSTSDNNLRITTQSGYVDIGPRNTGWAHFDTDRPSFHFNKKVALNDVIGSYNTKDFIISTGIGGTENERIRVLNSNGNVGIGTSSPLTKLHINGGDITLSQTADGQKYRLASYNSVPSLWIMSQSDQNNVRMVLSSNDMLNWDYGVAFDYTPGTIGGQTGILKIGQLFKNNTNYTHGITAFFTNGTERLRIDNSGNVGINTTSPAYKLDVNGNLRANTIALTNDTGDNLNHVITVYDSGQNKYGIGLWNTNGTSGEWATMIFTSGAANRRLSFGKVNNTSPSNHSHITEMAYFDVDDNSFRLTGDLYLNGNKLIMNYTDSANMDYIRYDDANSIHSKPGTYHFVADQSNNQNGNATVYVGSVYSTGVIESNESFKTKNCTIQYNSTTNCLEFIFA